MPKCALCPNEVSSADEDVYQEQSTWRKPWQPNELTEDTGRVAHGDCIRRKKDGPAPEQETLF